MVFGVEDKDRQICPMCNYVVTKLVPMYDDDQKHVKAKACVNCKRAIKAGKDIKKFKRDPEQIKQFVREVEDKLNVRRQVVLK